MIYPANFEEKIGFDRIREQVTALCSTPSAKAKLAEEGFSTSADEIERRLSLMNEMRSLLMLERDFPDGDYPDPAPLVAKIRVEGSYLLAAEADQLRKALVTVGAIAEFILGRGGARYPRLWELSRRVTLFPEIVRAMCMPDGKDAQVNEQLLLFQGRAMRTLAVAYAETTAERCEDALRNPQLLFVAVAAIADPVRDDVPAAVARCMKAGIDIKIVTGDTPATAREIARRIGLWHDETDSSRNEMTGVEFAAMSDEELLERVQALKIMSRARPLDKQRLVRLLQRKGEIVAVTGDGTNDAPALNFANVGLSMGSGTSVAKDASDITLLDDSFASIAAAVMWGRSLYRNIQRFVLFQLTINFAAIIVVFVGSIFGTEMPLTVVQILWVNIIMDTFAALAMASLPPNPAVMNEPPRPKDEFIITPAMARTIFTCGTIFVGVLLGMLFYWRATTGAPNLEQLTVFFSVFVFLQFWNMFNAKGFEACHSVLHDLRGSRTFFLVLLLIAVGQVLIVEFGGPVFRTTPLTWVQWLEVIGYTSLIAILGDVVRSIRRRIRPRPGCR